MNNGTYSEKIAFGGTLKVEQRSWSIQYYFPGPDARYNGDFVAIYSSQIEVYIKAFKENYAKFEELKKTIPSKAEFQMDGKMGMTIRVNGYSTGVCLAGYRLNINSPNKLREIIQSYRDAQERAEHIQSILW